MRFISKSGKRNMVLYHAVSSYQLLEVILHRWGYHRKEWAVLLLPDFITKKYPRYEELRKRGFFNEIYLFPYTRIRHGSEEEVRRDVEKAYQRTVPYRIEEFSDIYVAGAHFYFSLYLIQKQICFHFFEDAAGMQSRAEVLEKGLGSTYPAHAWIAKKYGLFDGQNPWICEIICLRRAQRRAEAAAVHASEPCIREMDGCRVYRNFSVEDELERLPGRVRRKLVRFFVKRKIRARADAILLTQQLANLGLMSEEEQRAQYEKLKRKLPDGIRLLIKKHPDDTLDYGEIFPGAHVIKAVFPAELLPYVLVKKPKVIYTLDSTGCENLKNHFVIKKMGRQ